MKVVLDTNVLISGIFFGGVPGKIVENWIKEYFFVYATPDILDEYIRVINELGFQNKALVSQWSSLLPNLCRLVPDRKTYYQICRDKEDNKFFFCALDSNANYLITGDMDLKSITVHPKFRIVSPRHFLEEVSKSS